MHTFLVQPKAMRHPRDHLPHFAHMERQYRRGHLDAERLQKIYVGMQHWSLQCALVINNPVGMTKHQISTHGNVMRIEFHDTKKTNT